VSRRGILHRLVSTGSGSYTGSGPFRFRSEIYYDPRYNTPVAYASTGSTFCGRVPILGRRNHYFSARIRVGLCRMLDTNFGEFPFRNCLEIRNGSRIGAPKAAKMGRRSPDRPTAPAKEVRSRRLQLFSKQFRKVNSRKFGCSILHILPHRASERRPEGFRRLSGDPTSRGAGRICACLHHLRGNFGDLPRTQANKGKRKAGPSNGPSPEYQRLSLPFRR
jgi:hypothetical protein